MRTVNTGVYYREIINRDGTQIKDKTASEENNDRWWE